MPERAGIPSERTWIVGDRGRVALHRPLVMGILNLTPDSFSDGGSYPDAGAAAEAALGMFRAGAAIVDVGGESTRPGAERISASEQIRRVVPAIERIAKDSGFGAGWAISVDTTLGEVARAAMGAGATIINDVSAGSEDEGMLGLAGAAKAGLILMHRLAPPGRDRYSDQYAGGAAPVYGDVVTSVREYLESRMIAAAEAGVELERVAIDPGLGFGKTVEQNLELIARTGELRMLNRPIVSGLSRKSFVGRAMGLAESSPAQRETGTVALTVLHRVCGASVFRVHDVGAAVTALNCVEAAR